MERWSAVLAGFTLAVVFVFGGIAQGAVTIGTNLTGPADEINPGCSVACTTMNVAVPTDTAPGGLTSPVNGTVTNWQFKSGHRRRQHRPAGPAARRRDQLHRRGHECAGDPERHSAAAGPIPHLTPDPNR